MQIHSIYAMDIFTIDTIFNQRFYVFFIIGHKTRDIIRFAVTENPVKEFVRQQIIEFEQEMGENFLGIFGHFTKKGLTPDHCKSLI